MLARRGAAGEHRQQASDRFCAPGTPEAGERFATQAIAPALLPDLYGHLVVAGDVPPARGIRDSDRAGCPGQGEG